MSSTLAGMLTVVMLLHPKNALSPIDSTVSGMVTEPSAIHI